MDQLVTITSPERELRRQEGTIYQVPTHVGDMWPEADVCWGSLVGAYVGLGYLVGIDVS